MTGRWMPVGQRFDGRYRKWSAGASINWNLENAELDRYASLCEIVTPKETGFRAAIVTVSIPGPRLNVVEKCKCNRVNGVFPRNADFVPYRDNCPLITRDETGLKTWLCIIPRDEKSGDSFQR